MKSSTNARFELLFDADELFDAEAPAVNVAAVGQPGISTEANTFLPDVVARDVYEQVRSDYLPIVQTLRDVRRVRVSDSVVILFENKETVCAQLHEQLRGSLDPTATRIARELRELEALIPVPNAVNLTVMIDGGDPELGRQLSGALCDGDRVLSLSVAGRRWFARCVDPHRDPDGAVHFLRFDMGGHGVKALKSGAPVSLALHGDFGEYERYLGSALPQALADDVLRPRSQSVLFELVAAWRRRSAELAQ